MYNKINTLNVKYFNLLAYTAEVNIYNSQRPNLS